ncbi:MAG: NAD(P)-binding domain-containing protein [Clostridia bacterium]|nr:NAD(P)-binding domain-containing protein [Clostridia bacterium]
MQEFEKNSVGKIAVLGGDGRTSAMACRLRELGSEVVTWGLGENERQTDDINQVIVGARAVILPMPAFTDEKYVFGTQAPLHLSQLLALCGADITVYGGRIPTGVLQQAEKKGVRMTDYMALEEVQLRNAIPSAEGAIALAMQALDITLDGARAAVLGYGRIGRALAARLCALGCEVSVAVRREIDLTRVRLDHYIPLTIPGGGLQEIARGYDVIFNTVPARIISRQLLGAMTEQTLLIELASSPGGWSPEDAKACGRRVIYAPGLPAKYAPRTAGRLIAESLIPYLGAKEVEMI